MYSTACTVLQYCMYCGSVQYCSTIQYGGVSHVQPTVLQYRMYCGSVQYCSSMGACLTVDADVLPAVRLSRRIDGHTAVAARVRHFGGGDL